MKTKLLYLIFFIFISNTCLANDTILESHITQNKQNPIDYLLQKLKDNDVLILGEKHNQTHQLEMVKSLIQRLPKEVPSAILALEIPTDEQQKIDYFLETGDGLKNIKFPHFLSNPLYKKLLITARKSGVKVLVIDMHPRLFKNAQMTRDEFMAERLFAETINTDKACKIFALVGNYHAIKTNIEWVVNGKTDNFLGLLLREKNPNLKVFSVCQITRSSVIDINQSLSKFNECFGCDANEPFSSYQAETLLLLNSKPINIYQAYDGVVYHH